MRVRTHLSLLAMAVFLPMIVGAGVAIKLLLDAGRHAALRGMQELAAGFDRHLKKPICLEDIEQAIGEIDLVR